jgi:DNA mismatch endonuclease (patch repair protein)
MCADHLDPDRRSWNMSRIRGSNTRLEIAVRQLLSRSGFRYRLNKPIWVKTPEGSVLIRPDLQNQSSRWVVFANGCFWHSHANCRDATVPKGGRIDWQAKLSATVDRDRRNYRLLTEHGWRVIVIWECGVKYGVSGLERVADFIRNGEGLFEWPAEPPRRKTR